MNAKLEAVGIKSAEVLRALIRESEKNILEAWNSASEEAQVQETAPVLRLGFTISLDLDANKMTHVLAFSLRRKLEAACDIPDPDQLELDALGRTETE